MVEQYCNVCNNELYIKPDDTFWCPHCEGIKPLSKTESIALWDEIIIELDEEINTYCEFYTFDYLLTAAYEAREINVMKFNGVNFSWNINDIVAHTFLIKNVLSGCYGNSLEPGYQDILLQLLQDIQDKLSLNNEKVLLDQEYGNVFCSSDVCKIIDSHSVFSLKNGKSYIFIPKAFWGSHVKKLREGNFARASDVKSVATKPLPASKTNKNKKKREKQPNENSIRIFEMIYNSFHYVCYNPEIFNFAEIVMNDNNLSFLSELKDIALDKAQFLYKTSVVKISRKEFDDVALKYNSKPDELYNMFVSSTTNIKKFPLLIEHQDKIVLSPETLFLFSAFFDYKLNKEVYDSLLSGDVFEQLVEEKLNQLGFKTDDPVNKGSFLRNRKIKIKDINGKEREREIDILAYDDSILLVVECKDWRPTPKILWKYQQDYRIDDIKEEIDLKHYDRVDYVKNNYKSRFGFKNELIVKGLVITRIEEEIDEYREIKILPRYELSKNLKSMFLGNTK